MNEALVAPAMDAPSEIDLVFDRLYRSSRDDVYAYVASLLRDRMAAEEVTATAFERAYRKRSRFDPRRGERRAWLFGIARNAALDELRRRGRSAELTAEPVDEASIKGDEGLEEADGIVLRSSIRDGEEGEAGADFELLVPSAKLGDTLAALSGIAEVRSRRESTQDITAPTTSAREKLRDSQATIDGLLTQLAEASTDAERAAVELKLRAERRQAVALRARLSNLKRRANFSRVSLRIETGEPSSAGTGGSPWGAGDALSDAGHILAVAAGVTIIGLAILAPIALIALLAWLAHRIWVRSRREHALG